MSCDHCAQYDLSKIPDGFVCAFCLDGYGCGCHESRVECLAAIVGKDLDEMPKEQMDYLENEIEANGHRIYQFCEECLWPKAECDVPGCEKEAYKLLMHIPVGTLGWLFAQDRIAENDPIGDDTFYYCENHYTVWRPLVHFEEGTDPREQKISEKHEDIDEMDGAPDLIMLYHPGSQAEPQPQGCPACDFPY